MLRTEYVAIRVRGLTYFPPFGHCWQTYQLLLMTTPKVQSQSCRPTRKPARRMRISASGSFFARRRGGLIGGAVGVLLGVVLVGVVTRQRRLRQ
jgi:hypothetical protein